MAAPSICPKDASRGNPRSDAGSVAATALPWNGSINPSRPMQVQIGTVASGLNPGPGQRFVQSGRTVTNPPPLVGEGALGCGQRQPQIMRDRGMCQEAPGGVEPVAQMRIVGQCAPPAAIGNRQDKRQRRVVERYR